MDQEALRQAQQRWVRSLGKRRHFLDRLCRTMLEYPNEGEAQLALRGLRQQHTSADQYLVPRETIGLPGERNEVIHDWALGRGLINTAGERFSDVLVAAAAAITMGNAVVLPASWIGREVARLIRNAGAPRDLVALVSCPTQELLEGYDFDFVVSHGPLAQVAHEKLFQRQRQQSGFVRFIGGYDSPDDPRYLTYFAYETVWTERTLHHGVDLDLCEVIR